MHRSSAQVPVCDRVESGDGAGPGTFRGTQRPGSRRISVSRYSKSRQRVHPVFRVGQVGRGRM